jgi:SAM-dependent methyltransferase
MEDRQSSDLRASYDRVSDEYVRRIFGELEHKPLDRQLLERLAKEVDGLGPVCDLGCGPGHVARYLHEQGVTVIGIDLSPAMVEHARRLNPEIEFREGDMLELNVDDRAFGGIAAFYSLIHIPRRAVVAALREMKRSLRPGGWLLLAFHIGDNVVHLEEWWGRQVSVDFYFFRPEEMAGYLGAAGFEVEDIIEREPYPDVEHPSRRAYLFARKPRAESPTIPENTRPRS